MSSTRDTIDGAVGGSLMRKTINGAFELFEKMANNNCLWPSKRQLAPKKEKNLELMMLLPFKHNLLH